MIPQLRKRDDGVGAGPVETIKRDPDEEPGLDLLGAVAEDLLSAIKKGDAEMVKAALSALVDHIQTADAAQDEGMA